MKGFFKLSIISAIVLFSFSLIRAENFVVVAKEGKVFDEPNSKYVTLNQKNQEVTVVPGMVFKTTEKSPGWYMIEYSPGLRAYIPEQITNEKLNAPVAGNYKISNDPSKHINVVQNGNDWKAELEGKSMNGFLKDNILVFFDENKKPAYTLVDLGNGGIVISYDNAVTNFF